jgi:hypothetical protein
MGVMARFWTKARDDADTSEIVMTSFNTASLKVREAVAGVPTAEAVTVTVVKGVTESAVPTI